MPTLFLKKKKKRKGNIDVGKMDHSVLDPHRKSEVHQKRRGQKQKKTKTRVSLHLPFLKILLYHSHK